MKMDARTAATITSTAVRVPQMTRLITSKPLTVVPHGWADDGACWVPKFTPASAVCAHW